MWGSTSDEDNTQNILVSIINNIQTHVINKLKPRLQKENILAYEADINEIKEKKRY